MTPSLGADWTRGHPRRASPQTRQSCPTVGRRVAFADALLDTKPSYTAVPAHQPHNDVAGEDTARVDGGDVAS